MDCTTVNNIVQDYLDARLPVLDRNEFVRHVSECPECETAVLAWREVFSHLRKIERVRAPERVSRGVMSHLRAEGLVYEPRVPTPRRVVARFLGLPAVAKYPLAAALVVATLYVPLAAVLGLAGGSYGSYTEALTSAYGTVEGALRGVSFLSRVLDSLANHVRAAGAVAQALLSVLASAGVERLLLGGALVLGSAAFVASWLARRKRAARNVTVRI
ncbi:MAG: zf-HC2 domain-containing protein [Candidatus Krumholzibacteria bacterium]|nr:zf-HC2 domain-containing protein [Candidatus Krumholzibacteria bacterium]